MKDHFHLLNTDIKNKRDLWRHMFMKNVWLSFVSLFIPAILYFELWVSLSGIFLYIMLHSIVCLLLMVFVSGPYISRHGTKLPMIIWILWFVVNIWLLMIAKQYPAVIFLAPLFSWVHTAFFWVWFHMNMSLNASKENNIGRMSAFIDSATMVAYLIWPLVWWLIADKFWESFMFVSCILFVLLSIVPLLASWKKHKATTFSAQKEFIFIKTHRDDVFRMAKTFAWVSYVQFIGSVLWSITLFAFFKSYAKLWLLSAITWILVVVLITFVWKIADKNPEKAKKIIKLSTWIQWVNWFLAWLAIATWFFWNILFMAVDVFHKITYRINVTYMNKIFYEINDANDEENPLYWVIIHELAIHWAKIVFCLIGALTFWIVGDAISYLSVLYILVILVVPLQLVLISTTKKSTI